MPWLDKTEEREKVIWIEKEKRERERRKKKKRVDRCRRPFTGTARYPYLTMC